MLKQVQLNGRNRYIQFFNPTYMKVLFTIVLVSFSFAGFGQNNEGAQSTLSADTIALLDKLMSRYADVNPGAQLAISRHGQIIYSSVRGMADLEHNVPLTKTSKIEAGSVSKQFTAAAILLLEQQGKLSLNDDVHKYIPELPNYGHTITLRHLMQHKSGLKDWGSIAQLTGWPRGTKSYTNDDALEIILRQKSLNNKPGDEYIYSNTGYTLLVHIVQRVSGMSHAEFSKKYLFEPAGMKNTEWRDEFRRVVANRASAYSKTGGRYVTNMPLEDTYGHGGLLTTAEDLIAWNNHYLYGKLGGNDLLQRQTKTNAFNNGRMHSYAAGLMTDSVRGWASIGHGGATAAYRANLEYFPQLGLSIAWLSNTSQADLADIASAARNIFVKNLLPTNSTPNTPSPNISVKTFNQFTGAYREVATGSGLKISIKDTVLMSEPNVRLIPLSSNTVSVGRGKIIFNNTPKGLKLITPAGDTLTYVKTDTARVDVKYLNEYAGVYSSEETESKMNILVKDGKLFQRQRSVDTPLNPVYKDGFSFPGGELFFEKNKLGKISKMFISVSRARKVEFWKM
jgi:CubicO group peptidase (beta-lactamase class C family)